MSCYTCIICCYLINQIKNLIKKTGRKGQGPGQFLAPRYLGISGELIYVTDQFKPGIQVFDKNLSYSRRE
jgi:hypothetical protein